MKFSKLKVNKKASMQLSINAIVILVMAMAVLGIGLGLIRGVLGSGQDKLSNALENVDLTEQATFERSLTNYQNVQVRDGDGEELIVGYYNRFCEAKSYIWVSCGSSEASGDVTVGNSPLPLTVGNGDSGKLGTVVSLERADGVTTDQFACRLEVHCAGENTVSIVPPGATVEAGQEAHDNNAQPEYSQPTFIRVTN